MLLISSLLLIACIISCLSFPPLTSVNPNDVVDIDATETPANVSCKVAWYGKSPLCDEEIKCPEDWQLLQTNACGGDDVCCKNGTKSLCTDCKCPYQYIGTAPFCNPGDCPDGWDYVLSDQCGDGKCCWTGLKKLCITSNC